MQEWWVKSSFLKHSEKVPSKQKKRCAFNLSNKEKPLLIEELIKESRPDNYPVCWGF
jgi:hypothetical protein